MFLKRFQYVPNSRSPPTTSNHGLTTKLVMTLLCRVCKARFGHRKRGFGTLVMWHSQWLKIPRLPTPGTMSKCQCAFQNVSDAFPNVSETCNRYDEHGEREYSTVGSAKWMEETKAELPLGTEVHAQFWATDKTNNGMRASYPGYQGDGALDVDRRLTAFAMHSRTFPNACETFLNTKQHRRKNDGLVCSAFLSILDIPKALTGI
jgi:hypothetical protein